MLRGRLAIAATLVALVVSADTRAQRESPVVIVADRAIGPVAFGSTELQRAFEARGIPSTLEARAPGDADRPGGAPRIVVEIGAARTCSTQAPPNLGPQGFDIRRVVRPQLPPVICVSGADAPGAMYGLLELAERVRIGERIDQTADMHVTPRIAQRGIKFNIPLDARTPSYSDDSTSAQGNVAEMWNMEFWTRFLDEMARHRYNLLSLWSLSPFPSLVKTPDYPAVALADVKRKTGALFDATNQGVGMFNPAWPLETLKTITIDEKIAFWRAVMQHARNRGIAVSIFTWNIFTHGTEGTAYGITDDPANPVTKDYFRKSVRALFNTYPLLASIGITSGEHMEPLDNAGKEDWLWETYGRGVSDAIADARDPQSPYYAPGRKIALIHRAHQADLGAIVARFKQLPGYGDPDSTLAFSFKYSEAHMYSSTAPRFIYQRGWFDSIPAGQKTWLTVRNDDMYYLRWGDPAFVRAYLDNLPDSRKIAGFYMGPDGYTWGRDLVSRHPASPRELVIERMWYAFLLWGRLSFDPTLTDARLEAILAARFPGVASDALFEGWASVSRILPLFTRFYWGNLDFKWYPEASSSQSGFETVQQLIDGRYQPMTADEDAERPLIMSVKAFVSGEPPEGRLTPLDVADRLTRYAESGLAKVAGLRSGTDTALAGTLEDIRAMAWLGRYYAEKTRGAVALARYQRNRRSQDHDEARTHLTAASSAWREYAGIWSSRYMPQHLTRMGPRLLDIAAIQADVDKDIPTPLPAAARR
jgi:hypothetical protein